MNRLWFNDGQLSDLEREYKTVPVDGDGHVQEVTFNTLAVRSDILKLIEDSKTLREAMQGSAIAANVAGQRIKELDTEVLRLEELVRILSVGSENEQIEELAARYLDTAEENRKMRFALESVSSITEGIPGEPGRQIRDIITNVSEELEGDMP